jgi:hypothetical protein
MKANFFSTLTGRLRLKLIKTLRLIRSALQKESVETTTMLKTYVDYTQGTVVPDQMKLANQQFRNLLKTVGLGALVVLPFAPLTIPIIVKVGQKMGVDILPPSFRGSDDDNSHDK